MTPEAFPSISLVIPTHNRRDSLKRTLEGLSSQSFPLERLEVVVVADGCTDDTVSMLRDHAAPFALHVVTQPGNGAAMARNAGAAQASGDIIIFLDDDIEATPDLLRAHVNGHKDLERGVVIGYVPPILSFQKGFFKIKLREWWEHMFYVMTQKDHRFNYRDLLSGNFSISRALFQQVSGFNTAFKCQEDYELGVRLIKAEANVTYAPAALGYHHEVTDLDRSLRRKLAEGEAAILFCRTYPELLPTLPLLGAFKNGYPKYYRLLLLTVFYLPALGDALAWVLRGWLRVLEPLRMRRSWDGVLGRLLAYWYLRGAARAIGSFGELTRIVRSAPADPHRAMDLDVDIQRGIAEAEGLIDQLRPAGVHIWYGQFLVGSIPAKAGAEPVRGRHLRPALAKNFSYPLMEAIAFYHQTSVRPVDEPAKLRAAAEVNYAH